MGLENLQSIFSENLDARISDFSSGLVMHSNDSRIAQSTGAHIQSPILSTMLIPKSSFVDESALIPKYDSKNYDPRLARPGTLIINKNTSKGTVFDLPLSPTETQTEFSLTNDRLKNSKGWQALYTKLHTAKPLPSNVDLNNPFQPADYGPNVNRDTLNIRYNTNTGRGNEPYVISPIPTSATDFLSGRILNMGKRESPQIRSLVDLFRVGSYLKSTSGLSATAERNIPFGIPTAVTIEKRSADSIRRSNLLRGNEELDRIRQRYNFGFTRANLLLSIPRFAGMHIAKTPSQSGGIGSLFAQYSALDSFGKLRDDSTSANSAIFHSINGTDDPSASLNFFGCSNPPTKVLAGGGDKYTTSNLEEYNDSFVAKGEINADDSKTGMPFYFVDLRDNTVTYFRAYLNSINENITPSWTPTNYIGRSEAVYTYTNTTRDISFNLNIFAHTRLELQRIYVKINRLTSMCYPEYAADEEFSEMQNMTRMKPPLAKLRLGDLYGGAKRKELTGFIRSLTYTVPEESPWEMNQGEKVPKYVQATINYQVIHSTVPDLKGFVGTSDSSGVGLRKAPNSFYGITDNQPLETRDI